VVGVETAAQALLFQEEIPEGAELAFAWRETLSAVRDRTRMLAGVAEGTPGLPSAAVYFNCVGRGRSLFLEEDADLKAIRAALPGVPLLGMASSFELGPSGRASQTLMYCGVLAALSGQGEPG
jgi:small ligand-binding sensory domain FIST